MSKKMLVLALSLAATVLLATNSFGQACSSGVTVHYVGIGSSAQFNTLAFGAVDALKALPGNSAITPNVWTVKTAEVIDVRPFGASGTGNPVDKGLSVWVIYDSAATCNAYIGFQADSVQGDKDFYCMQHSSAVEAGTVGSVAACYGFNDTAETGGSWQTQASVSVVPGLPNNVANLPASIQTFLITPPKPVGTGASQTLPPAYCGQTGDTAKKPVATTIYCYFNAAHTDIRAEDGLFATTRALSSYNTTNAVFGLGYNQTACGATFSGTKLLLGCPINDSFNANKVFFPLPFGIKGTDPITTANVPTGTTLTLGASPIVVFVNNADSTGSLGFGAKVSGAYLHHDVARNVLSQIFEGVDSCTGDLLTTINPTSGSFGGKIPGHGQPIQAILREPLSGTYNTFEFTAVRTYGGSGVVSQVPGGALVALNKVTSATTGGGPTWVSDAEGGQELDVRGTLPDGPATGWTSGTNSTHCAPFPDGTESCGNPLFYETGNDAGSTASTCAKNSSGTNRAVKLRAIGTGEEIGAVLGTTASPDPTAWTVEDGIGYAFWGYSNFKSAASGCTALTSGVGKGGATCTTNIGHYLTVDSIDPLFVTGGGQLNGGENWSGAFQLPQCAFIQGLSGAAFPCPQVPFTHLYDGKYPLWTMLRIVSFANVTATATVNGAVTPEGVINVVGFAQTEAAPGSTAQLSDFAPFLSKITGLPYTQGGTAPTGGLNLGVFRVHFQEQDVPGGNSIAPNNGHSGCGTAPNFTSVALQGGTPSNATCLVDAGGDMGGAVRTVQSDVDYLTDLGGAAVNGITYPAEIYNLHQ
jgi:hypothetical protein